MKKAYIEVRTQSAKGIWPKRGPDVYIAVQVVPDGVARLTVLNQKVAQKRGIEIIYVGEGYSNRIGERSMYGQAMAEAEAIVAKINQP